MILQPRNRSVSRRAAFTLLEVLVVVAIILVLASVATVAVLQVQRENKADMAKINATNLAKAVQTYMVRNPDAAQPQTLQEVLKYVEGGDEAKLLDPWNQPYQLAYNEQGNPYVFTTNPDTGETIRSDAKK